MNPHNPFLRNIFDNPADDGPRCVYADYLEELGGGKSGEALRAPGEWLFFEYRENFFLGYKPHDQSLPGVRISGVAIPERDVESCPCGVKNLILRNGHWQCEGCYHTQSLPLMPWDEDEEGREVLEGPADGDHRALTIWQPWATLVVAGAKKIETRSWPTTYRGPLLVHAAKKWNRQLRDMANRDPFHGELVAADTRIASIGWVTDLVCNMPLGALLGSVRLVACLEITEVWTTHEVAGRTVAIPPRGKERTFGDYTAGRFAWVLDDPRPFRVPVPVRGGRQIFRVPAAALAEAMFA